MTESLLDTILVKPVGFGPERPQPRRGCNQDALVKPVGFGPERL